MPWSPWRAPRVSGDSGGDIAGAGSAASPWCCQEHPRAVVALGVTPLPPSLQWVRWQCHRDIPSPRPPSRRVPCTPARRGGWHCCPASPSRRGTSGSAPRPWPVPRPPGGRWVLPQTPTLTQVPGGGEGCGQIFWGVWGYPAVLLHPCACTSLVQQVGDTGVGTTFGVFWDIQVSCSIPVE